MKQLGLALGGGGLKGLAHIGVLQVLQDNQIPVSFISGTSAGGIFAALLAAGVSPYEMEKIVINLKKIDYIDYNSAGIFRYLLSLIVPAYKGRLDGIIAGQKIEKLIYDLTKGKKLEDIVIPTAIIACDIDSGKEVIFANRDIVINDPEAVVIKDAWLSEAVRASISVPATFVPKNFDGMQLVDGGVKDIVPVAIQRLMGAEYILAINLGQEIYEEKVAGIPQIISRTISIMTYETSDTAQHIYADMVIHPRVPGINLDEIEKAPQIIRAGRRAMKARLEELINQL